MVAQSLMASKNLIICHPPDNIPILYYITSIKLQQTDVCEGKKNPKWLVLIIKKLNCVTVNFILDEK